MEVQNVRTVLAEAPELVITEQTTADDVRFTARDFGMFDEHPLGGRRWRGLSPWERHPDGDELLMPLDGDVDLTLLTDEGEVHLQLASGSIFVVPRGLWHRQHAARTVTEVWCESVGRDEISFADDPRTAPH